MTAPTPDPAAIARRLSPAQRKVLLWCWPYTDTARLFPQAMTPSCRAMAPLASGPCAGLLWPVGTSGEPWYRITREGLLVRAELERMEAPHD